MNKIRSKVKVLPMLGVCCALGFSAGNASAQAAVGGLPTVGSLGARVSSLPVLGSLPIGSDLGSGGNPLQPVLTNETLLGLAGIVGTLLPPVLEGLAPVTGAVVHTVAVDVPAIAGSTVGLLQDAAAGDPASIRGGVGDVVGSATHTVGHLLTALTSGGTLPGLAGSGGTLLQPVLGSLPIGSDLGSGGNPLQPVLTNETLLGLAGIVGTLLPPVLEGLAPVTGAVVHTVAGDVPAIAGSTVGLLQDVAAGDPASIRGDVGDVVGSVTHTVGHLPTNLTAGNSPLTSLSAPPVLVQ